jgi:hypothetical protein
VGVHSSIAEDDPDDMSALTVDVLGATVAIVAPAWLTAELRAALVDLQPGPGAERELALSETQRGLDLRDNGRVVRRGVDPGVAAATVVWRLNAIAGETTGHVLLHGACVAGRGGAVVLPGGPGAGKSMLAAACVRAGLSYLSDELVALDRRTGAVAPYAKPLTLQGERLVSASSLGPVAAGAVNPTALAFPRYRPGADGSQAPLDRSWALLALAAHATNLPALGGAALAWLAGLAAACPARQLTHGDAGQSIAAIERMAETAGSPVEPAEVLNPITGDTTTVAVGDSLAVLHTPSGRVHVLNPGAAAVWRRAAGVAGERDVPSLVDVVVDAAVDGRPDRSTAAVTVDRLVRTGLLPAPSGT